MVDELPNDIALLLAGLAELEGSDGEEWHSSLSLSRSLLREKGVSIHWKTIDARLHEHGGLVTRKRKSGRWNYLILEEGRREIGQDSNDVSFVDPENALQAVRKLHDLLSRLSGSIAICDPYVDETTIEHLCSCPKGCKLRILSTNIQNSGPLHRVVAAAKSEGHHFEMRIEARPVLHDRYIIDDKNLLILGSSLKGFGKKQCFVTRAGGDIRATVLKEFEHLWGKASPWV
jgi:hypothetical protein